MTNILIAPNQAIGGWTVRSAPATALYFEEKKIAAYFDWAHKDSGLSALQEYRNATNKEIGNLPSEYPENWNGRGAKAITKEISDVAAAFLDTFSKKVPKPDVSAMNDGSICFMWTGDDGSLLFTQVYSDGHIVYAMNAENNRQIGGRVDFDGSSIPDIEQKLLTFIFPTLR